MMNSTDGPGKMMSKKAMALNAKSVCQVITRSSR
jgi:hypothetical protein